jgi:prepilin-type N-terminal cleavage/methylation domain-containing protein
MGWRHPHRQDGQGRSLRRFPRCYAIRARVEGQDGFTLVELLVVMIIGAIISVAVLAVFTSLSGVFNSQTVRIQNQDDARTAVNEMSRYLRMATSSADNMTTQSNAIATASPQDIEFYCDIDGDSVAEKVRFYLSSTTLLMQTAEPVWVTGTDPHYVYGSYDTNGIVVQDAVRNGSSPVFAYYYYINPGVLALFTPATAAQRQLIVTVSIAVTVNEKPTLAKGNVLLTTDVQLRQRYQGGLTE